MYSLIYLFSVIEIMIYVILFLVLYVIVNNKLIRFIKNECKKIINTNIQNGFKNKTLLRILPTLNKFMS